MVRVVISQQTFNAILPHARDSNGIMEHEKLPDGKVAILMDEDIRDTLLSINQNIDDAIQMICAGRPQ